MFSLFLYTSVTQHAWRRCYYDVTPRCRCIWRHKNLKLEAWVALVYATAWPPIENCSWQVKRLRDKCHVIPKGQGRDRKIFEARYLNNWSSVGKHYFSDKTASINIFKYNGKIQKLAHRKQQKSLKMTLFSNTLAHNAMQALSHFVIFAVFDVRVLECYLWKV